MPLIISTETRKDEAEGHKRLVSGSDAYALQPYVTLSIAKGPGISSLLDLFTGSRNAAHPSNSRRRALG